MAYIIIIIMYGVSIIIRYNRYIWLTQDASVPIHSYVLHATLTTFIGFMTICQWTVGVV